jgi:hypothetical protein
MKRPRRKDCSIQAIRLSNYMRNIQLLTSDMINTHNIEKLNFIKPLLFNIDSSLNKAHLDDVSYRE